MKLFEKMLMPIVLIFVLLTIFILSASSIWIRYTVDKNVLLAANLLFLTVSVLVFFMQKKALTNANPNVFVRSIIAGMMIKMFSTAIAVLVYVLSVGNNYNSKGIFIALFMYLIYLAVEVFSISKENKKSNG
jgi:hypothetical protein